MSLLETTVEDLKSLPPAKLAEAADYIHKLKRASGSDGKRALERAFGCLEPAEADAMERGIMENCERVDAEQW